MIELSVSTLARLPRYVDALKHDLSPDNARGRAAAEEQLATIEHDAAGFIERQTDPEAKGHLVTLPDGSQTTRVSSRHFWIWDSEF